MTEPIHPFSSTPTATAASHTPYPVLHFLHRRCDAPVAVRGAIVLRPTNGPLQASASQAHTPRLRLAHALLLLSHSHSYALPLAAPHVATLGSRALQIHPPFRQTRLLACLLASIAKHCPHHSFGFELCEFPRHHHPIPVSRDFTFTSGYLCLTLRRFASQHSHLHARH
jgi:hypothetical protein